MALVWRLLVLVERPGERPRAGKEPLLEQQGDDVARALAAVGLCTPRQYVVEGGEGVLLVFGRGEGDRLDFSRKEALLLDVALKAADDDRL